MKRILFLLFVVAALFVNAQNNDCSGATTLMVGADFTSGAINSSNIGATTDGSVPSCRSNAVENVWFSVVVPASGNLKIETKEVSGSSFDDSVLTVYSGTCGSLTEVNCSDDEGEGSFSLLSLTGQTPGTTLYVSVWKYDSDTDNGEFQISAYDPLPPSNDNCSGATPLTIGTDFASGTITSNNLEATTDGTVPSCNSDAIENVWFSVVVPQSGNLTIETKEASGSSFDDTSISVYSGTCGSLTEVGCNEDDGDAFFSLISLTGQTPGTTLYVSVWKFGSNTDNGGFQIAAYDSTALSTQEVAENAKKISVSPNPFSDLLRISNISKVKSVSVTDALGRWIKTIEKPSASIYLGDLKEGIYFMTLKMNDGSTKTLKTIKK